MSKHIKIILLVIVSLLLMAELCFLGSRMWKPEEQPIRIPAETPSAAPTEAPTEPPLLTIQPPAEVPAEAPTEEPTEVPTEVPTEEPNTEPEEEITALYRNPLTGEPLEEPLTLRLFAFPIGNDPESLPHVGTQDADILFEMYASHYATRCLALFTDITQTDIIGPVWYVRYNFTDLAVAYDAYLAHASASQEILRDLNKSGVDDIWVSTSGRVSFRDKSRTQKGYSTEDALMADGPSMYRYLTDKKRPITLTEENRDYGLHFVRNGTPTGGEDATKINITFRISDEHSKLSTMTFDPSLGRYIYTQYGRSGEGDQPENFENVFVMLAEVQTDHNQHIANLDGSGDGFYACNGKIIPIRWHHEKATDPITFTHLDGTPLEQGIGNSYIAIAPLGSDVEWA